MSAMLATEGTSPLVLPRVLAGLRSDGRPIGLEAHLRRHGPLPFDSRHAHRGDELVRMVERAGLTGRGGAAFPVATKMAAVRDGRGRPIVVANGVEGEPASGKDKVLLTYVPHLVLDGAVLAARAIGARKVIVATAHPAAAAAIAAAIVERHDRGVAIRLAVVPDRFLSGEETALIQFLNGGPCLPTFVPPRPFERGVGGAPTLVQNVETLAHLALIARHGPGWFRALGTDSEPGSVLVTLSGAVRRPGVYEVAIGTPLADLVEEAGGLSRKIQAFLCGGYFGSWIRAEDARPARLADADLAPVGAALGARAIVALPADTCGVAETARVARYLAHESAGQCGPCIHGLAAVANDLSRLNERSGRADEALLRRRLGQIPGRGACRHPDGAVKLVASALTVFETEFARHFHGHRCHDGGRPVLPTTRSSA
jgi:NADH:ubiquinone oxidoreductase subunit F (NADH-binding)